MDYQSLLPPLILIFLLTILYYYYLFIRKPSPPSNSLTRYPIIGTAHHLIKNSDRLVDWAAELLLAGPTDTVVVFPIVFTINPSNIEHITKSNFDNYPKCEPLSAAFHDYLGDGIVNLGGGEQWRQQRKSAGHVFSTGSSRSFVMENLRHMIQERLVPLLADASKAPGRVIDLQDVLERLTFDNICRVVFDYDPNCLHKKEEEEEGERLFRAFEDAGYLVVERAKSPFSAVWKLKKLLNIGSEKRLREAIETINKFVERSIQSKQTISRENRNFLSQFQQSEDLRDMLINIVLAGGGTTPSALTWFFWLLSSRPEVVNKIREEIRLIRSSHQQFDKSFTILDSLRDMEYLHAALTESMRLYPPVSMLARECKSDDTLPDGTVIKKGWMVMYNNLAMGRAKRIWGEDCLEFKPERWLVDGVFRAKNQFQYPVFFAGPRVCLGKDIAYVQMKAVAASILESFVVEVVEERGKHQVSMTLRMEGGLPVMIKEMNRGHRCD